MIVDKQLFVDSNYFVALFNPTDSLHKKAISIARILDKENYTLIFSNFIFLEVTTVLSLRLGKSKAIDVGSFLLSHSFLRMIVVDEILQNATWSIFQEIKEKNMSFVDCSNLAIMRYEHLSDMLTFDKTDFSKHRKKYSFHFFDR